MGYGLAASTHPTGDASAGTGSGLPGWLAPIGWLLAGGLFALCGAFTKETAVLLPLYALVLDRVLYPEAPYWQRWLRLPAGVRLALVVAALAVVFGLAAWHYAPGYAGRPFTPFGPPGFRVCPNFVARKTLPRMPRSARPITPSLWPQPYMSELSRKFTPRSMA